MQVGERAPQQLAAVAQALRRASRRRRRVDETDTAIRARRILRWQILLLADTIALRDLYKKRHWQVAGPTFYQLHPLFDKHYGETREIVDALAERIQLLGG